MNRRVFVGVQKLNRIFDRHDVVVLRFVNEIDYGGQRRALTTAGWTSDEHDTILQFDDIAQL